MYTHRVLSLKLLMCRAHAGGAIQLWPPLVTNGRIGWFYAPVTWNVGVVYGSRKGQTPENPWMIAWHVGRTREILRRFLTRTGAVPFSLLTPRSIRGFLYFGPYKVRRQSCWDRTGALTGPVVCWVIWASFGPLMCHAWPLYDPHDWWYEYLIRHPHGPTRYLHMYLMEL